MDFAGGLYASIEAAEAECAVDGDLKRGREAALAAKALLDAGKLIFQDGDDFTDGGAARFNFCLAAGEVAKLRGDKDAGHERYDDNAFQTFGGDMGRSVRRFPVA